LSTLRRTSPAIAIFTNCAMLIATLIALAYSGPAFSQETVLPTDALQVDVPALVLRGIPFSLGVAGAIPGSTLTLEVDGERWTAAVNPDGTAHFDSVTMATRGVREGSIAVAGQVVARLNLRTIPGWLSILPPLLAIAVALLFRQVIPALYLGILVGSVTVAGLTFGGVVLGVLATFQVYVIQAVTDPSHAAIMLFSFMIGGMVGIVIKNGGMQGVVNIIVQFATSARRGQVTTAALGLAIFFDDYANTLVVGNTMRQVTDRLRISREKLAYLVDSTAAPVACVALVTTWIGYQVGLIGTAMEQIDGLEMSAYSMFLSSIPYSFYPVFTMAFVFMLAGSGRDFGPMLAAETRARTTGQVLGPGAHIDRAASEDADELRLKAGKPVRAVNALLPLFVLVFGVLAGLYATGQGDNLRDIIGSADSYAALMWASLASVLVAALLSQTQGILSTTEVVDAWYSGVKAMLFAMIILVLSWSLSGVSTELHTADYLVSVLSDSLIPGVVPALVFVLAAATAFATGSSWATMGILMPLVLPLVWAVLQNTYPGGGFGLSIMYSTVACVLAGAVLGDHCSPISDTTILSSMASGCDHVEHVRTQLPYAMTVGAVSVLIGTLPTGFGVPWWISMPVGLAVLFAISRLVAQPVPEAEL
jgi:Na+/H+ antiporter NhaC